MQWVLVTGSGKGVGRAIALRLAQDGFGLFLHYHKSKKEVEALEKEIHSLFPFKERPLLCPGDLSTLEGVKTFASSLPLKDRPLYGLINNVGPYLIAKASLLDYEELMGCFHMNCAVPLMLTQAFLPSLEQTKGCVINIGVCGSDKIDIYTPGYTLAKNGLEHLTKSLAKELFLKGVRFNMISPGYLPYSVDMPKQGREEIIVPEEEVARSVAFLLNPLQAHITGQNLEIGAGVRL